MEREREHEKLFGVHGSRKSDDHKVGTCTECGRVSLMANKHLCFRCYRRVIRASKKSGGQIEDRHTPFVKREHNRLMEGFTLLTKAFTKLSYSPQDIGESLRIASKYLEPLGPVLKAAMRSPLNEEPAEVINFNNDNDDDEPA